MPRLTTILALFTLCLFPFSHTVTADDSPDLGVLKAKIRFGKMGRGDSLALSGAFDPGRVSPTYSPESGGLSVSIGPATVISLPSEDPRASLKFGNSSKFVYVVKKTREAQDSLKLAIDLAKGKFSLKCLRIDLESLKAAGPKDVPFALSIGDAVFTNTLTLGEKDGRWRFRFVAGSGGWPPGIPGITPGGGGGGGIGGGAPVSFRTLRQGSMPGLTTFQTLVVRTETAYYTEWFKRFPPPPPGMGMPVMSPPKVDFATEMVVIIDLGVRPTGGYLVDIRKASAQGGGLRVEWVEKKPGANCVVTQATTMPFVIAAVSRRDGAVSFSGSVQTVNCP
jgi:hypothetical protein